MINQLKFILLVFHSIIEDLVNFISDDKNTTVNIQTLSPIEIIID